MITLVTFKKYIFLMSSTVYFTPVMMVKGKLIIDGKSQVSRYI